LCLVLPDGAAVFLATPGFKNSYIYFFVAWSTETLRITEMGMRRSPRTLAFVAPRRPY